MLQAAAFHTMQNALAFGQEGVSGSNTHDSAHKAPATERWATAKRTAMALGSQLTQTDVEESGAGQGQPLATIHEDKLGQEEEEEEEEEKEEEEEEGPITVGGCPPGQTSPATSATSGSKMTISTTPLQQESPLVDPMLGEWNCYERDFPAYFATWPEPQDGHPDDYKEHHKLLTRVIRNVVNVSPNSNFFFMPCLHAIVDLFPCPEGMELRVPISVFDKRHLGQDAAKTWEFIVVRFQRKTYRVPEKGKLVVWLDIVTTPGHFAFAVWQSRDGALVAPVFIYDSCVSVKVPTRAIPYSGWQAVWLEISRPPSLGGWNPPPPGHGFFHGVVTQQRDASTCWARCVLAARAIATFFLWRFFVKMPVPGHSGVTEPPQLLIGDDDVDTLAKVWAPFFECAHISENPSFNTKDRLDVVYPHLHGKLTRFPIEFFPLATNSPCFSVGNLPQTVRHFGFSDTAANKIALTLDIVPTKVFTSTAASGVRKLWVRALPEPHNEHAYADRKRALQETNGSQGAWPETSWQDAVESVLFVECQSRTVKHCGYSIRSVREWHNDYEMRRGIQHIKNKRFTKSTNTCQPCRGSSAPRTVLVDNRYYQWEVAAASSLGVVPWLEQNRPEVLAELRKVRNLCTGRLAQSKSLVPLGVVDDRYRMDVCAGNEDAATYSRPGLAFIVPAQDVHASPPKGGVNPAFATRCPRCKEVAGVSPCFRIFLSLHPNTGAMMPGPEWQILSYHVPGMAAFLPEVDHKDEAYRRMHETARTMAAAKEMRHWSPEAHIGDDDYILEDVKAARGANEPRPGAAGRQRAAARGSGAPTRRGPGQRGANAPRPGAAGRIILFAKISMYLQII
eukprot:jgi/Tetstr1/460942/TSEL_006094.t1